MSIIIANVQQFFSQLCVATINAFDAIAEKYIITSGEVASGAQSAFQNEMLSVFELSLLGDSSLVTIVDSETNVIALPGNVLLFSLITSADDNLAAGKWTWRNSARSNEIPFSPLTIDIGSAPIISVGFGNLLNQYVYSTLDPGNTLAGQSYLTVINALVTQPWVAGTNDITGKYMWDFIVAQNYVPRFVSNRTTQTGFELNLLWDVTLVDATKIFVVIQCRSVAYGKRVTIDEISGETQGLFESECLLIPDASYDANLKTFVTPNSIDQLVYAFPIPFYIGKQRCISLACLYSGCTISGQVASDSIELNSPVTSGTAVPYYELVQGTDGNFAFPDWCMIPLSSIRGSLFLPESFSGRIYFFYEPGTMPFKATSPISQNIGQLVTPVTLGSTNDPQKLIFDFIEFTAGATSTTTGEYQAIESGKQGYSAGFGFDITAVDEFQFNLGFSITGGQSTYPGAGNSKYIFTSSANSSALVNKQSVIAALRAAPKMLNLSGEIAFDWSTCTPGTIVQNGAIISPANAQNSDLFLLYSSNGTALYSEALETFLETYGYPWVICANNGATPAIFCPTVGSISGSAPEMIAQFVGTDAQSEAIFGAGYPNYSKTKTYQTYTYGYATQEEGLLNSSTIIIPFFNNIALNGGTNTVTGSNAWLGNIANQAPFLISTVVKFIACILETNVVPPVPDAFSAAIMSVMRNGKMPVSNTGLSAEQIANLQELLTCIGSNVATTGIDLSLFDSLSWRSDFENFLNTYIMSGNYFMVNKAAGNYFENYPAGDPRASFNYIDEYSKALLASGNSFYTYTYGDQLGLANFLEYGVYLSADPNLLASGTNKNNYINALLFDQADCANPPAIGAAGSYQGGGVIKLFNTNQDPTLIVTYGGINIITGVTLYKIAEEQVINASVSASWSVNGIASAAGSSLNLVDISLPAKIVCSAGGTMVAFTLEQLVGNLQYNGTVVPQNIYACDGILSVSVAGFVIDWIVNETHYSGDTFDLSTLTMPSGGVISIAWTVSSSEGVLSSGEASLNFLVFNYTINGKIVSSLSQSVNSCTVGISGSGANSYSWSINSAATGTNSTLMISALPATVTCKINGSFEMPTLNLVSASVVLVGVSNGFALVGSTVSVKPATSVMWQTLLGDRVISSIPGLSFIVPGTANTYACVNGLEKLTFNALAIPQVQFNVGSSLNVTSWKSAETSVQIDAVLNGNYGSLTYIWSTGASSSSVTVGAGSYVCKITNSYFGTTVASSITIVPVIWNSNGLINANQIISTNSTVTINANSTSVTWKKNGAVLSTGNVLIIAPEYNVVNFSATFLDGTVIGFQVGRDVNLSFSVDGATLVRNKYVLTGTSASITANVDGVSGLSYAWKTNPSTALANAIDATATVTSGGTLENFYASVVVTDQNNNTVISGNVKFVTQTKVYLFETMYGLDSDHLETEIPDPVEEASFLDAIIGYCYERVYDIDFGFEEIMFEIFGNVLMSIVEAGSSNLEAINTAFCLSSDESDYATLLTSIIFGGLRDETAIKPRLVYMLIQCCMIPGFRMYGTVTGAGELYWLWGGSGTAKLDAEESTMTFFKHMKRPYDIVANLCYEDGQLPQKFKQPIAKITDDMLYENSAVNKCPNYTPNAHLSYPLINTNSVSLKNPVFAPFSEFQYLSPAVLQRWVAILFSLKPWKSACFQNLIDQGTTVPPSYVFQAVGEIDAEGFEAFMDYQTSLISTMRQVLAATLF